MHTWKRLARNLSVAITAAVLAVLVFDVAPAAAHLPPGIPASSTALSQLNSLTVASESHDSTYNRDLFPHWVTVSGTCSAREYVLRRDGENVTVGSNCYPTSGRWHSDFDNVWTSTPSSATIDHVVALKEAWTSGAWSWTTARRQSFANDISSPQLWIASTSVNSSKGDRDPAEWVPPVTSVRCNYAKAWINVKYRYGLSVNSAEKTALRSQLSTYCGV
ncbi:HNH endonuclease family protein [Glycomyces buryatensis]|uniref:HNH endonuclease n=1 Tax=Glycomyces buryatensis TaxID=2570927 RepID=A0A4S8QEL4_9ACTN|nr:HNH endonuclease family protein [Glycomyces buryatensis]THV42848.1 HNH endonuclease [Glycomyces buryatensis]